MSEAASPPPNKVFKLFGTVIAPKPPNATSPAISPVSSPSFNEPAIQHTTTNEADKTITSTPSKPTELIDYFAIKPQQSLDASTNDTSLLSSIPTTEQSLLDIPHNSNDITEPPPITLINNTIEPISNSPPSLANSPSSLNASPSIPSSIPSSICITDDLIASCIDATLLPKLENVEDTTVTTSGNGMPIKREKDSEVYESSDRRESKQAVDVRGHGDNKERGFEKRGYNYKDEQRGSDVRPFKHYSNEYGKYKKSNSYSTNDKYSHSYKSNNYNYYKDSSPLDYKYLSSRPLSPLYRHSSPYSPPPFRDISPYHASHKRPLSPIYDDLRNSRRKIDDDLWHPYPSKYSDEFAYRSPRSPPPYYPSASSSYLPPSRSISPYRSYSPYPHKSLDDYERWERSEERVGKSERSRYDEKSKGELQDLYVRDGTKLYLGNAHFSDEEILRMFEGRAQVRAISTGIRGYCLVFFETPRDLDRGLEYLTKYHPAVQAISCKPNYRDREHVREYDQRRKPSRCLYVGLAHTEPGFDVWHAVRDFKKHVDTIRTHSEHLFIQMDSVDETIKVKDFLSKYYPSLQVNYYWRKFKP